MWNYQSEKVNMIYDMVKEKQLTISHIRPIQLM